MKGLLIVVLLSLAGCMAAPLHLPPLQEQTASFPQSQCEAVYPTGDWQFVHSISFLKEGGQGAVVIGVTTLAGESIRCGLMTIEGLTLFEAVLEQGEKLAVVQALPPFDKPAFAQGLMEDIRTIFLPPGGRVLQGQSPEGQNLCRYVMPSGKVVDVHPRQKSCWRVKKYGQDLELERTVSGCGNTTFRSAQIPDTLTLEAFAVVGYSLNMKLLSATPLR